MTTSLVSSLLFILFVPNTAFDISFTTGLLLQSIALAVLPLLPNIVPDNYWISLMICVGIIAAGTSLVQNCALMFAAQFPTSIQRSLQMGMGG